MGTEVVHDSNDGDGPHALLPSVAVDGGWNVFETSVHRFRSHIELASVVGEPRCYIILSYEVMRQCILYAYVYFKLQLCQ